MLVGIPEGKRLFGGPRRRREDNFEVDLKEIMHGMVSSGSG